MTPKKRLQNPERELTAPKRDNRRILTVALIVFASLYQQAMARIGETPEQCQARYGKPIEVDKDNNAIRFKKGEMLVTVFFLQRQG